MRKTPGARLCPEELFNMHFNKTITRFLLVVLIVICIGLVFDKRIALFVQKTWAYGDRLALFSSDIPDLLFLFVCLITAIAWAAYFYLARKGIYNTHTRFFQLIAITTPLTFFLKSLLKYVFGRINTRYWLGHPGLVEFHWFDGSENFSGFPSGHMAVFTALAVALWKFYPRYRREYVGFLAVLALALIVTDYHFISDIIAGVYVGFIVDHVTASVLTFVLKSKAEKQAT